MIYQPEERRIVYLLNIPDELQNHMLLEKCGLNSTGQFLVAMVGNKWLLSLINTLVLSSEQYTPCLFDYFGVERKKLSYQAP